MQSQPINLESKTTQKSSPQNTTESTFSDSCANTIADLKVGAALVTTGIGVGLGLAAGAVSGAAAVAVVTVGNIVSLPITLGISCCLFYTNNETQEAINSKEKVNAQKSPVVTSMR